MVGRLLASASRQAIDLGARIGPPVHLDDYHYVRFMWQACEIAVGMERGPLFIEPDDFTVRDPREWETLICLLNEDYAALGPAGHPLPASPAEWMLARLEAAHERAGMPSPFAGLDRAAKRDLITAVAGDAASLATEIGSRRRLPGSTVVIEFSRGGPEGASLPLDAPHGYAHALGALSPRILERGVILYVHVTPQESRLRNRQRAEPGPDGSVMAHSVPESVMRAHYGTDDMPWLVEHAQRPGTVTVRAHASIYHVPVAIFDNQHGSPTLREMAAGTQPDPRAPVYEQLRRAFARKGQRGAMPA
mgnify:CR=1 FL=1